MHSIVNRLSFEFGGTRVAYLTFDKYVTVHFPLNLFTQKREVREAMYIPRKGSETNVQAVMAEVKNTVFTAHSGDRPGVDNVAIVITDGNGEQKQEIDFEDLRVFPIGMGKTINSPVLDSISTENDWHDANVKKDEDVEIVVNELMQHLCT